MIHNTNNHVLCLCSLSGILLTGCKNAVRSVNAPKPVQLPSYKKESRGFDSTVSIVPTGQSGWRVESSQPVHSLQPSPQPPHVNDARSTTPQPSAQTQTQVPASQATTSSTQASSASTTAARWAAPAVPQPVKYTRTVVPASSSAVMPTMHGALMKAQNHSIAVDVMSVMMTMRCAMMCDAVVVHLAISGMNQMRRWISANQSCLLTALSLEQENENRCNNSNNRTNGQHIHNTTHSTTDSPAALNVQQPWTAAGHQSHASAVHRSTPSTTRQRSLCAPKRLNDVRSDRLRKIRSLREQHQRAQAKLAEIEAKLGRGSVSSQQQQAGTTGRIQA